MDSAQFSQNTRNSKKSILYTALNKCKRALWYVFWFSSAINVLMLFLPLYTSQVLDRVISSGSMSTLVALTVITILAFSCSSLLDICRSLSMMRISDWLDGELCPELITKAINLTVIKAATSSGEVMRDLGTVKGFITGYGIFSLFDLPWAALYLICIFLIHPFTGIIALFGVIILMLMALWNELATKGLMQETTEGKIKHITALDIATRNAEVVEAMGMIRDIVDSWIKKDNQFREMNSRVQSRSSFIMGITRLIRSVLQIAVMGTGAFLAITEHKTGGSVIAASILMGKALSPFENAMNTWKKLISARLAYKRLHNVIFAAPLREGGMSLPAPNGIVVVDRVFFTPYGSNKPTIKGISFSVESGDIVGIIGASGSGKSTVAKILMGVWKPLAGSVRLDGADVYYWNRSEFGKHVGYLPQYVELFNDDIKTNIARMISDPNPEEVIKAAKIVGIHEMILSLPNGYDTIIGGNGLCLSGGQKQLLGLARAFYGQIKMLVLDEPNASLDARGEAHLMKALDYAKQERITTFVITHKLQLLGSVNKLIVMHDGIITASGSRDEVLKQIIPAKPTSPSESATTSTNE